MLKQNKPTAALLVWRHMVGGGQVWLHVGGNCDCPGGNAGSIIVTDCRYMYMFAHYDRYH